MNFIVKSGKIKECIQDKNGNWVTPNRKYLVALADGTLLNGCKPVEEEDA